MKLVAAIVGAILAACGGGDAPVTTPVAPVVVVPPRRPTAGDALLGKLPAGADLLVEVDLARLRGNAVIGEIATRLLEDAPEVDPTGTLAAAPLARADAVVLAAYRIGTAEARTIGLVTGGGLAAADLHGGIDVGDGVVAVGPPEIAAELRTVGGGQAPSLAGDDALRALRARAMPAQAETAAVRVTARLGFDARVALASELGLDIPPSSVSVWGDVADDAALVALLEAPESEELAEGLRAWLARVAAWPEVKLLGLAPAVRGTRVEARGDDVKVVALVGPKRLARAAGRARTVMMDLDPEPPRETP